MHLIGWKIEGAAIIDSVLRITDDATTEVFTYRNVEWSIEHLVRLFTRDHEAKFHIGSKDRKRDVVSLSYKDLPNILVLERIIVTAFKQPGLRRLSELI